MAQVCDACENAVRTLYRIDSGQEVCSACYRQLVGEGPPALPRQRIQPNGAGTDRRAVRMDKRVMVIAGACIVVLMIVMGGVAIYHGDDAGQPAPPADAAALPHAEANDQQSARSLGWSREDFERIWGGHNGWIEREEDENRLMRRAPSSGVSYTAIGPAEDATRVMITVEIDASSTQLDILAKLIPAAAIVSRVCDQDLKAVSAWMGQCWRRDMDAITANTQREPHQAHFARTRANWWILNEGIDGALVIIEIMPTAQAIRDRQ